MPCRNKDLTPFSLGWVGAHWFYLGNKRRGWKYLALLPFAAIMMIVSWVDAIRFIWVDRTEFEARFVTLAEAGIPLRHVADK